VFYSLSLTLSLRERGLYSLSLRERAGERVTQAGVTYATYDA
jgi:hypothetical protein